MPVSSPSFSNRALFAVGAVGLVLVLMVLVTGGFVLDAGVLHLSVRSWMRALVIAVAAISFVTWRVGRGAVIRLTDQIWPFLDRHAPTIALIAAAAAAADGVAFGTYAAAGADSAGYVSQGDLIASGRVVIRAPLSQQVDWPEAAAAFSPLGYRPGTVDGELVPTYPPGLSMVIAVAQLVGGRAAWDLVVPILGAIAVMCTFALGWRLHSRMAGLIASLLLATSPILLFQIPQPMSDVPAAAWWSVALWLASRGTTGAALTAGFAAGLAFLTRPVLLPMLAPVALVIFFAGGRLRPLLALVAGFAPSALGLALLQQYLYGTPFGSGHGSFAEMFGPENIPENISRYADRFLAGEMPAIGLLIGAALALALLPRPGGEAQPSPLKPVLLGALSLLIALACYLPYGVFKEWWYFRFILPALPPFFVAIGALVASACYRLPSPIRSVVLLTAITLACSFNVNAASFQEAFLVRRSEARYQITGRYLESMLPENAVVVSSQHSASAYYYAGRPIVRWDLLQVDLDDAISDLVALGRRPILVLEDWEERAIGVRFPMSTIANLDWRPIADIGDHVRVRVYDPAERGERRRFPNVDRIHAP